MSRATRFDQVVAAAERLSLEEQETLADILHKRAAEARRRQVAREARAAQREHVTGRSKPTSIDQLMREVRQ